MRSLIGNKSAEKDVRDWLTGNGYCGKTAEFTEIELHAIERPGWLQVFRFELHGRTAEDNPVQLFGAMRSDASGDSIARQTFRSMLPKTN